MAVNISFPGSHPIHEKVRAYREERERQELALTEATGGYAGDIADYHARGGKPLITFKDWLKSTSSDPDRHAPVSRETYTPDTDAWGSDDDTPAWARESRRRFRILIRR